MSNFYEACGNGDLELAKKLYPGYDLHSDGFIASCGNGHIEICKWLHSIQSGLGVNIEIYENWPFRFCCSRGQIVVAKWLYGLGADIHAVNDDGFVRSCIDGHLEIAKWLHGLGADIHVDGDAAFEFSCVNYHIEITKWLLSVGEFSDELVNAYCCAYKDQSIFKLIFDQKYTCSTDEMRVKYDRYIEIKQNIKNNCSYYLIPDLSNLVYDYV